MNANVRRNSTQWSRHVLPLVLASLVAVTTAAAHAAEVEEIVVTGSYIKRDNFDTPSPINVVDQMQIREAGTPQTGEIIWNQTFNFGVDAIANGLAISATGGTRSFSNVRGLGPRATLDLMDGRRMIVGDANFTYPQIALQRIETLKDGAAALYGSDAVAGVVNYIPRKDFEGVQVQVDYRGRGEGRADEYKVGFLGGLATDTSRAIVAVEIRDRDILEMREVPELLNAAAMVSGQGNPGTWAVPRRQFTDANGNGTVDANEVTFRALTGAALNTADPACGNTTGSPGTTHSVRGNTRFGLVSGGGTGCTFEFGEFWNYQTALEQYHGMVYLEHAFTDRLRLTADIVAGRQEAPSRGSPINSGARYTELVRLLGGAVLGEHPGNPFRAFIDADNDRIIDAGEQLLYAQDRCTATACTGTGDGVPDRDLNGDGVADPGAQGNPAYRVVLAANAVASRVADPTNPAAPVDAANGGIPFNEDVVPSNWRPFTKQVLGRPTLLNSDGSAPTGSRTTQFRFVGGLEYELDKSWTGSVHWTYIDRRDDAFNTNASVEAMARGLRGQAGSLGNQFYNPFATSQVQCVNRVCGSTLQVATAAAFNATGVVDQIYFRDDSTTFERDHIVEVLATGDLLELPAGTVASAFGAEWVFEKEDTRQSPQAQTCDRWTVGCAFNNDDHRSTYAAFYELRIPVFDSARLGNLELSHAGRYTDVQDVDDSFDPKLAVLWRITDWVSLRGSWGTAFIAPSLSQLNDPPTPALQNIVDETCLAINVPVAQGGCSTTPVFTTRTNLGNPDLQPEEADVWNAGFTLLLLDGALTLQGDYIRLDFDDRITSLNAAEVTQADVARFQAFLTQQCPTGDNACKVAARTAWIDPATKNSTGANETRNIQRSPTGTLENVLTSNINAQSMKVRAMDLSATYRFDGADLPLIGGDYGAFSVGLEGTYTDEFSFQLVAGGLVQEAAGGRNDYTATVPPIQRLRLQSRLTWARGNHSAAILGHFGSGVRDEVPCATTASCAGYPTGTLRLTGPGQEIASLTTWDIQYSYTAEGLLGASRVTEVSVGANNVFDRVPSGFADGGGIETFLHDPRGQMLYLRITQDL